jgi:phosphoribosylglycinamide formyltransferase 1
MGALQQSKCLVGVFASGSGSNLQAFIDEQRQNPSWPAQIAIVVSDKPECYAVQRAREADIPVFVRTPKAFASRSEYEVEILHKLKEYKVEWLLLAGYMRLVGPTLLDSFPQRILNIHPSWLPAFPGRTAVADAVAAGATETGVTVHYVDEGMDTGPIIAQRRVTIPAGVTEAQLAEQIHGVEHELYPAVVGQVLDGWIANRQLESKSESIHNSGK